MDSTGAQNNTNLSGRWLRLARAGWAASAVLYFVLYASGVPAAFAHAAVLSAETHAALASLGIPSTFPAGYWSALDTLTFLGFAAVALFIVWRRPDDWLVMLTSLMLLGTASLYTAPPSEAPLPVALLAFAFGLAEICQIWFVYLFPNGRFVPHWLWVLLVPLFVWRPLIWGIVYLPDLYQTVRTGDNYGTLRQDGLDIGLMLLLFVVGIVAQVYRYRRVSTPEQRQQTKWLVLGMICAFIVAGLYVLLVNVFGVLEGKGGAAILGRMVGRTFRQLALLLLPLTLAFSILRYRLWDIDLLLRRTLVYVPLTGILTGMIAALISLSKRLTVEMVGQNSILVTIGITLLAVAVSEPLKDWLQDNVDRRFKYAPDPQQQLRAFGARVEQRLSRVEAHQLLRRFCDQAVTAFEACGGAAYIAHPDGLKRIYARGDMQDERITIPLLAPMGGERVKRLGAITLSARPFGRAYERQDRIVLGQTAAIVAAALAQDETEL